MRFGALRSVLFVVGGIIIGTFVWPRTEAPKVEPAKADAPVLSDEKIILGYRYGHPFDPYKGRLPGPNADWTLDPNFPPQKPFVPGEKIPLNIAVINNNEGVPIDDVVLEVSFRPEDHVQVNRPEVKSNQPTDRWIRQATGIRYAYQWSKFPTDARNPDSPPPRIFPEAGEYPIQCTVSVRAMNQRVKVHRCFEVLLG